MADLVIAEEHGPFVCECCRRSPAERAAYLDGFAAGLELAAEDWLAFNREQAELEPFRAHAEERGEHLSPAQRWELEEQFRREHAEDEDEDDPC